MPKKYPIGIQSFDKLREENFLYIDKTPFLHDLVNSAGYYFLSRPRRFGKSLFVNTIEALFQGKKELFKGLFIEDKWNWEQTNPVIKISFSNIDHKEIGLSKAIKIELRSLAKKNGFELESESNGLMFRELIETIAQKNGKVVVLIDEYDKPIIDYLGEDTDKALENQSILKGFYSILKDADDYLRMVFITGVSKFSRVSIFSDLNNLRDLTTNKEFAGICGITQKELENNFTEELRLYDNEKIKLWYNGYTWDLNTKVYNPFSLLNFFVEQGEFKNYWFVTGTPTFLINLSKKRHFFDFEGITLYLEELGAYGIEKIDLVPLMFQTGYLTLKKQNEDDSYELDYPNLEVRRSFLSVLANAYIQDDANSGAILANKLKHSLENGDLEKVQQILNTLFKSIPYTLWQKENEHFYHAIIHLIFKLLGIYADSEVQTSDGRMDALVRLEKYVYCFEFKLDESAEMALAQIEKKEYLTPYLHQNKTCIGIGVNFSKEEKKVKEFIWKKFSA
ncbi:PD-(D/E)XK nuclease superfamily protein [Arcicella aurantiaca]|uniref:PD-(D/E)XK nuclease superfamily protein n=1 Tax=Arcicella aurantiaca TaxID=591202 RepID=A0A316EHH6_9BACT|nr:ATP-binding protein [Arcicella aurantiaca]PWK29211.1 PD-(D/E)XK nuclease superfamily protein [Arcicella aurantiaca]